MTNLVILGTDTAAGKTSFALLWLAHFAGWYEYWKPVETGDSDSECIRSLVPGVEIHAPLAAFREPVAPPLAARRQGNGIPTAVAIAGARPRPRHPGHALVIETFGSPLSPLNESELQLVLIQALDLPSVLITSASVGAIGRTLQALQALAVHGVSPAAVVLLGPPDPYAVEQIAKHGRSAGTFALEVPRVWDVEGVALGAREQAGVLKAIQLSLPQPTGLATTADIVERDRHYVWHPYTSLREPDPPLVTVAAQDEFLWLADGSRVIDGISSWWTILHGHRHPVLMTALREAAASFDHVHFAGLTHRPAVELAERLLQSAPWTGGRVFFSDNGSTAVEVGLKMAYQYWCHHGEPQRTLFIGFEGGYHGDTFGAMAVGREPVFFGRFEPLLFQAEIVPVSAPALEAALRRHPNSVAAVIIEPLVQGAGGMRMHTPDQLRALFEIAGRHNVLFIADEVMTGGGRTGTLWAHQAAGIAPALICAAKTLAGGVLPLAVTLASPEVVSAWDTADPSRTFFHGHSFTAHPLACAVAVANWKLLEGALPSAPLRIERVWNASLGPLRKHRRVRDVRICGTIAAVALDLPGGYLAPAARQLRRRCRDHGVLLRPLGNVLYAMPPFCTSDSSLQAIAEAMIDAVNSIEG